MVDLPTIPDRIPQAQAPQSKVSPSQIASPYMELASSLDLASKELGDYAKRQAHEAGLTAVTRDDQGKIKVDRPPIVGDAAIEYQHAVKTAAVTDGENVVRTDLLAMRHKFSLDPVGFAKAAQTYSQEKVGQYRKAAGPEVGLALGRIAQDTAREFHEGLLNQKEHRDIANAKASIEASIETTQNELYAIKSGGADDSSPEVQTRYQKIGALYGQLTGNPKFGVAKATADYQIKQFKSEMEVASLGQRLETIQKEKGVTAALEAADNIRTDPSLNLTPAQWFAYHSRLVTGINQRERANEVVNKQTDAVIDDFQKRATEGLPVTPEQIGTLRATVAESKNPLLAAKLENVETILPTVQTWQKMSPAQLQQTLVDLNTQMREHGATPAGITLRDTGEKLLKNMREGIAKDPIGWANKTGALPIPPIDWAGTQKSHATLPMQLRDRVAQAEVLAAHNGVAPSYLTPDDKALLENVSKTGGQPMLDLAGTIVAGAGDRAPKVLAELGKDSPILAHVGSLMREGGSPALLRDAAEAVALRQNKDFTHPRWLAKESDAIQTAQAAVRVEQYGDAFVLASDAGHVAETTANAAFYTRSYRNNYDPKFLADRNGKAVYERTLQEAAGATFDPLGNQYGGVADYNWKSGAPGWRTFNKVLVPSNIRADKFGDVMGALRDEDVAGAETGGKKYTASDFRKAIPVAARGGYRFAVGDPASDSPKWIAGKDGQPFVLDLDRLAPVLRQRVPDAYAK